LRQCTISGNTATFGGGGIVDIGHLSLGGTIVSANEAQGGLNDIIRQYGTSSNGVTSSLGYNIAGDTDVLTWLGNDQVFVNDPMLGPIQDNGGPTETMAPLTASPALDASNVVIAGPFSQDQRGIGFLRHLDSNSTSSGTPDVGAVEYSYQCSRVVSSSQDNGVGSTLRSVISCASDGDTITFAPELEGLTISLTNGSLTLNSDVTILAEGTGITIDGMGLSSVVVVNSSTVKLINLTITGGSGFGGGGIINYGDLTVERCLVTGNQASGDGGGISNQGGTIVLEQSTVSNNISGSSGGGLASVGGIGTTVEISGCTFNGNQGIDGAGVHNAAELTINQSTFAGNIATNKGGAIHANGTGTYLRQSTLSGNQADLGGGAYLAAGIFLLNSNIISGNTADTGKADLQRDAGIGYNSWGYNLVGDVDFPGGFTDPGDVVGIVDPRLAPLHDNGGPTQTMALLYGSAALDSGDPSNASLFTFDQRGDSFPRELDGQGDGAVTCDKGAYEATTLWFGIPLLVENTEYRLSFNTFDGSGFAPDPTAGQLDSDGIIIGGVSDESTAMHFGHEHTSGDFARGSTNSSGPIGGFYAFDISDGNMAIGMQPTAGDFTPGWVVIGYQNRTAVEITSIELDYNFVVLNAGNRRSGLRVEYASDSGCNVDPGAVIWNEVAGSVFTTPLASDAVPTWDNTNFNFVISDLNVPVKGAIYLRFYTDNVSGSGTWDSIGLDDISVLVNPNNTSAVDTPMFTGNQTHLMGSIYPNPFNPQAGFSLAIRQEQQIMIEVFDISGRRVKVLHDGPLTAGGTHSFSLDGSHLPSSVYFVRVAGESFSDTRRAVLIK